MIPAKICPTCGTEYPASERFCPRDGTALRNQDATADLVGSVIAERYHVMRKLGEGGMGAVYLAEHVKMGRKSAIKVMNPGMSQDPDAIARFNREAANASRMNHPNICAIYDFGETADGLIYLAMEYIEGRSLTDLIRDSGSLPPKRAASILHQTADALQVAHDYGIVHRDLKPDNIMIAKGRDDSDVVKVVDFGIAKAHTSDAQKVTKTGLVVGTPEYMSPEQLAGDKLDGRSDIYSLALVGFNMLTGALPFPAQTAQETMIMRLTDDPKTLADMKPEVAWPESLEAVLRKALAREVDDRYRKASDFGREFSAAIETMPATIIAEAGTVVLGAKAAAATAAIPQTRVAGDSELAQPTPIGRRSMVPMIAAGGVAVAAIVVAVAMSSGAFSFGGDDGALGPTGAVGTTGTTGFTDPARGSTGNTGSVDASGDGSQTTQRGGNPGDRVGNPGERGTTGTAGQINPPPVRGNASLTAAQQLRADLRRLDSLTLHASSAEQGLALANRLLVGLTGEDRAEVLLRRGTAHIHLGDEVRGCADVRAAANLTDTASVLWRGVQSLLDVCN